MYKKPGVRSGAWLTEREGTYGPLKGIGNYGLVPVGYKYENEEWEKTKKQFERDFQKIRKSAKTASESAKDAIKKAYDWTGIWGVSALGSAGGLAYVCIQHTGDEYGWLKGVLGGALAGSIAKLSTYVERKREAYRRELIERKKMKIQREIRDLLKEVVRTPVNGDLNKKIGYKGRLEILLKTLDEREEMAAEQMENMKNKEMELVRTGMEELYRIQ